MAGYRVNFNNNNNNNNNVINGTRTRSNRPVNWQDANNYKTLAERKKLKCIRPENGGLTCYGKSWVYEALAAVRILS
jgi:hypothetical protein